MMHDNDLAEDEIAISYASACCSRRDLVLLKSVLSLYGAQGHAVWHYHRSREVDVLVIGPEIASAEAAAVLHSDARNGGQAMLWINDLPVSPDNPRVFQCKPPLRALQLVAKLKQIELYIRQQRARQAASPRFEGREQLETARFALIQWPPLDFFSGDKDFLRMSSMLSVRRMTLDELTLQSTRPREKCRKFLYEMHRAGYARLIGPEEENPLPPASAQSNAPKRSGLNGLFSRIRASLGLSSA
ncbi:MAG: hypothetical protein LBS49_12630 [Candidatus Accumulibacter sp.]|jgi:hypothetical protein|nr:hypothetical protein [Accumulibacter sp.]